MDDPVGKIRSTQIQVQDLHSVEGLTKEGDSSASRGSPSFEINPCKVSRLYIQSFVRLNVPDIEDLGKTELP